MFKPALALTLSCLFTSTLALANYGEDASSCESRLLKYATQELRAAAQYRAQAEDPNLYQTQVNYVTNEVETRIRDRQAFLAAAQTENQAFLASLPEQTASHRSQAEIELQRALEARSSERDRAREAHTAFESGYSARVAELRAVVEQETRETQEKTRVAALEAQRERDNQNVTFAQAQEQRRQHALEITRHTDALGTLKKNMYFWQRWFKIGFTKKGRQEIADFRNTSEKLSELKKEEANKIALVEEMQKLLNSKIENLTNAEKAYDKALGNLNRISQLTDVRLVEVGITAERQRLIQTLRKAESDLTTATAAADDLDGATAQSLRRAGILDRQETLANRVADLETAHATALAARQSIQTLAAQRTTESQRSFNESSRSAENRAQAEVKRQLLLWAESNLGSYLQSLKAKKQLEEAICTTDSCLKQASRTLDEVRDAITATQSAERAEITKANDELIFGDKPDNFLGELVEGLDRFNALNAVSNAQSAIEGAGSSVTDLKRQIQALKDKINSIESIRGLNTLNNNTLEDVEQTNLLSIELTNFTMDLSGFNTLASDLMLDGLEMLQLTRSESQLTDVFNQLVTTQSQLQRLNSDMRNQISRLTDNERQMLNDFVTRSVQRILEKARENLRISTQP